MAAYGRAHYDKKTGRAIVRWFIEQSLRASPSPSALIERGQAFVQSFRALTGCAAWDWKCCPQCGNMLTIENGSYTPAVVFQRIGQRVRVQHHLRPVGAKSYSEPAALLVRGSWYAREVQQAAADQMKVYPDWVPSGGMGKIRWRSVGVCSWM